MMYEPYIELAERLVKLTPGEFPKKAIFFNSGAEAVENAVKIARWATGRPAVIVFDNAYHGRTLMTMTMTSKVKPYKYRFGPYAPEVYRAPFPYPYRMNMTPQQSIDYCIQELERMFVGEVAPDQVAAIIIEPVQGEGGFMVAPPPGTLGGTYSGNPVACAAALAVLDLFEKEDYAARSREIGHIITKRFLNMQEHYYLINDVRGLGGMAAMELVKDHSTKEPDSQAASDVLAAAHHRGLVLIKAGM